MNWNDLNPDYWATRQNVADAVDDGFFELNSGQSKPTTDMSNWVTKEEATTWLNLDTSVIPTKVKSDWWLPIRYYKGDFLTAAQTFNDLFSPVQLGYDSNSGLIFFADRDNPTSGVWYFDPTTAKDKSDFGYVAGLTSGHADGRVPNGSMWPTAIVVKGGFAYMQGNYTGGMKIINCLTQALDSTITYGNDGDYHRGDITIIGDQLWATDSGYVQVIDSTTNTKKFAISRSSFPQWFNHSVVIGTKVGSNVWVLLTQGPQKSVVEIYPFQSTEYDYTNDLIAHFEVDEVNKRDGTNYIDRTPLYDADNGNVYISSGGDNKIYVYDDTSYTLKGTITMGGTAPSVVDLFLDEHGGKLYASYSKVDGTDPHTSEIDRVNLTILRTVQGVQYRKMAYVASTGYTYTADPGNVFQATNWDTDGKIRGLI